MTSSHGEAPLQRRPPTNRLAAADDLDRGLGCIPDGDTHHEVLVPAGLEFGVIPVVTRAMVGSDHPAPDDRPGVNPRALEFERDPPDGPDDAGVEELRVIATFDASADPRLGDLGEPARTQGCDGEQQDQRTTESLHMLGTGCTAVHLEQAGGRGIWRSPGTHPDTAPGVAVRSSLSVTASSRPCPQTTLAGGRARMIEAGFDPERSCHRRTDDRAAGDYPEMKMPPLEKVANEGRPRSRCFGRTSACW